MEGKEQLIYAVLMIGTLGMLLLVSAIVLFVYSYQRKLLRKKLEFQEIEDMLKNQEMKSAYAILEGQDIERKRLAREIHDNLGSILVTLNMYSDTALATKDTDKKNKMLEQIGNIAIQANDETRKLSHKLDSGALNHFGLKTAVKDLLQVVEETGKISVKSNLQINDTLNNEISINLYRIIQELINNTLKHANASYLSVTLSSIKDDYISLIYEDDGIGFDKNKIKSGIGLKNITSRIEKLSGEMNIEHPARGTCIIIEIPLNDENKRITG